MRPEPDLVGRILERITLAPARWPAAILVATAALTVLLVSFIPRVRLDSSMETIFHADDPERHVYEAFKATFGEDEIMVVALKVPEGDVFRKPVLEKIRRITRAIEVLPDELGVDRVFSLANVDDVRATEDGFEVMKLVPGAIPDDAAALERIRRQAFRNPLYVRNLVSPDGRAAAINVWLKNRPGDKYFKEALLQRIRAIVEPERGPEEIHYAGIPILTAYTSEYLRRDIATFVPLTILFIAVVLYANFRSVAGVLLPLTTVGLACIWMVGMIGLAGRTISIVSSAVPSLVLACGTAEVIHVMGEYFHQDPADPRRLERTLRRIFAPVFIAGATTVAGFGAMLTYDVPQIFDFGLYSAFGIFAEMLLSMFFVPAALHYWKPRPPVLTSEEATGRFRAALLRLARFDLERPHVVLAGAAVSVGLGIWGCLLIRVDTDYASYFKRDSPPVRALLFMRENLSGERPINIVIRTRGDDPGAALEPALLARVEALERRMTAHPLVGATLSIAGYLRNFHRSMNDDDEAFRKLPPSRGLGVQYLDLYGRPGELARYVSHDRTALNVIARSSIISSDEFLRFMDELRDFCRATFPADVEVTVTGSMYLLSRASIDVAKGQALSFGWADGIIFLFMLVLFRSVKVALLSLVPNVLPILWCYGLMGFAGIPLSTGTSVIAAMALGIVVDDTVHILARYQQNRARGIDVRDSILEVFAATGRPVILTGVTNFFGFLVLAFSSFAPLIHLGWLTALTMLTALSGDLIVMPALLVLFDRRESRPPRRLTPDPDG